MSKTYIGHGFVLRENPWEAEIDPIATGKQLRSKRLAYHLTQQSLSDLICEYCVETASRIAISGWETGRKTLSLNHVVFLAWLYNCTIDELLVRFQGSDSDGPDGAGAARPLLFPLVFSAPTEAGRCQTGEKAA
ncbi:MAG: helix-turn-helix domain-containing protein [Lachnospiraceae bacterium]|nr:helix-turn-helix domain-containing protein [Lachnospiraceae bacterium]